MNYDLIFYVIPKRKWHEMSVHGKLSPQKLDENTEENKIVCATSVSLKNYLDSNFKGRKNLLLLVIDKSRVKNRVVMDSEENLAIVEDSINLDAILDKITINCNDEGVFDIETETN